MLYWFPFLIGRTKRSLRPFRLGKAQPLCRAVQSFCGCLLSAALQCVHIDAKQQKEHGAKGNQQDSFLRQNKAQRRKQHNRQCAKCTRELQGQSVFLHFFHSFSAYIEHSTRSSHCRDIERTIMKTKYDPIVNTCRLSIGCAGRYFFIRKFGNPVDKPENPAYNITRLFAF